MLTSNRSYLLLLYLLVVSGVTACATTREPFELRIHSSEFAGGKSAGRNTEATEPPAAYELRPGDVVELLFRFNQTTAGVYLLQPGDVIRTRFPAAPELDVTQTIGPDGKISLPYLEEIQAARNSVGTLRNRLEWMYRDVLVKPELYIVLQNFGKRVRELKQAISTGYRGQSRLVTVREDYVISIPIIGEINVRGLTVEQLSTRLNARYVKVNRAMSVDLSLTKTRPPRLYVFGQVNNPGVYTLYEPVTLVEALAISGGANHSTAALQDVVRLHRQGKELIGTRHDLQAALNGDPQTTLDMVEPNDVIFVPRTGLASTSQIMEQVRSVLSFNGIGFNLFYDIAGDEQNSNVRSNASAR